MLTQCVYCRGEVSSNADSCPKCSAARPLGVECAYCQKRDRIDQVVPLPPTNQHRQVAYTHQKCVDTLFALPASFKCPECNANLSGRAPTACPTCGNRQLITARYTCGDCGAGIYSELGQTPVKVGEEPGDHFMHDVFGHAFCRSARALPKDSRFTPLQTASLYFGVAVFLLAGWTLWPHAGFLVRALLVLLAIPALVFIFFTIIGLVAAVSGEHT